MLTYYRSAREERSQHAKPPAEAAQLTKSCSKLLESSGEASASTSTACQRNKAIASMHMRQGRAAVRKRRGCPETNGGHAYLVMHQSTPGICSRLVFEALSFVRAAIIEEVEDATSTRARSGRAPVPWQTCHEQAQRRSRQSLSWSCTGAVAGGLTWRASMA